MHGRVMYLQQGAQGRAWECAIITVSTTPPTSMSIDSMHTPLPFTDLLASFGSAEQLDLTNQLDRIVGILTAIVAVLPDAPLASAAPESSPAPPDAPPPQLETAPEASEPLMKLDEVARYLSVSRRSVEQIIADGELVPLYVRKSRRFTRAAVEAYLRRTRAR